MRSGALRQATAGESGTSAMCKPSRSRWGRLPKKLGRLPKRKPRSLLQLRGLVGGCTCRFARGAHLSMVVLAGWRYPSTGVKLRGPWGKPRPLH
jgi:hypothetical protein